MSKVTAAVTEGGAGDSFTVVLNTLPTGNVIIDVAGTADVTAAPASLTFTPGNWNVAQTVTLGAVDDASVEGPENSTVVLSTNAATADANYLAVDPDDVVVTVTDNDTAGVTVAPTTAAVTEGGAGDSFTVVLNTLPTGNVIIDVAGTADVTAAPASLTFTPGNWNVAQTVTLGAVDDASVEGPENSTVVLDHQRRDGGRELPGRGPGRRGGDGNGQ